jgi:hypothetical protein
MLLRTELMSLIPPYPLLCPVCTWSSAQPQHLARVTLEIGGSVSSGQPGTCSEHSQLRALDLRSPSAGRLSSLQTPSLLCPNG